jgi:chromate transporter
MGMEASASRTAAPQDSRADYTLFQLLAYFLRLGALGFGGPIALVGYMDRDLVGGRGWITKEQYLRGLAVAQLAPGPLAAQLAMYIGYLKGGIAGSALVGLAFVLPSFLMVIALGWAYVRYGGIGWMQAAFYGIGAAVIGIIVKSAHKLAKMSLKKDPLLWGIFLITALLTAWTEKEIGWMFLACGFATLAARRIRRPKAADVRAVLPPAGLAAAGAASAPAAPGLAKLFLYFAKCGAFVFGSGLAIVPFLYGGVVREYHWLTERQFLDAVAVAMITPGPVVITVGFIGYLIAGLAGASAAAGGVFAPTWFFVVVLAPYFEKHGKNAKLAAFVEGVTAAATGAIAGAVFVLGKRSIVDVPTALMALAAFLIVFKTKFPEPILIVIAGILGWGLHHFGAGV